MNALEIFMGYASAFERTFHDDDWSRIEPYFARDIVYEVRSSSFGCRVSGRAEVCAALKRSLDGFDRRMQDRTVAVTRGPACSDSSVEVGWRVTYRKPGAPELRLEGSSVAEVRDDEIVRLTDEFPDGAGEAVTRWIEENAPGCSFAYV